MSGTTIYFIEPDAELPALIELMADEAAVLADDAASIADMAADDAAMLADAAASDDVIADEADIVAGGVVVVVVVVSSFFVQAAHATAAAIVAINRAVLMVLLDLGSYNFGQLWEPSCEDPSIGRPESKRASHAGHRSLA